MPLRTLGITSRGTVLLALFPHLFAFGADVKFLFAQPDALLSYLVAFFSSSLEFLVGI